MTYRSELRHREHYVVEQPTSFKEEAREQFHNEERGAEVDRPREEALQRETATVNSAVTIHNPGHEIHDARSATEGADHDQSHAQTIRTASAGATSLPTPSAAEACSIAPSHPLITQSSQPRPGPSNLLDIGADL